MDIEESAVDIAKLRLWLSLVVDEDDYGTIKPLPNLEYKIVIGNSLLGVEETLFNNDLFERLETLKGQYFSETRQGEKGRLKGEIATLIKQLTRGEVDFDFKVYFSEVFQEKGGFDIVIGNPPYVRQESLGTLKPVFKRTYSAYHGSADLYAYFIERGVKLLGQRGTFCYIVANKWMRANYGRPLRQWLKKQGLTKVIDFGDLPVFETATTYPCIMFVQNQARTEELDAVKVTTLQFGDLHDYVEDHRHTLSRKVLADDGWSLAQGETQMLLDKLRTVGKPLGEYVNGKIYYGIKTGLNEAFVIDAKTRQKLIEEDPKSEEVIKPFLAGRDIKKYTPPKSKNFLVFAFRGFDLEEYPAIKKHLSQYKDRLAPKPRGWAGENWQGRKPGSYKWYEIQDTVDYYKEFEKPKIMYLVFQVKPAFTFDASGTYGNNATWIIPKDDKFLLGILNSKVGWFLISHYCTQIQNGYQLIFKYLGRIPIRTINPSDPTDKAMHDRMVALVERMLSLHEEKGHAGARPVAEIDAEIRAADAEIDALVYRLYGLTEEEIKIVEGSAS